MRDLIDGLSAHDTRTGSCRIGLRPARVKAFITTRAGGVSTGPYASMNLGFTTGDDARAVEANRRRLRTLLPDEPRWLKQVHGARVVDADTLVERVGGGRGDRAGGRNRLRGADRRLPAGAAHRSRRQRRRRRARGMARACRRRDPTDRTSACASTRRTT